MDPIDIKIALKKDGYPDVHASIREYIDYATGDGEFCVPHSMPSLIGGVIKMLVKPVKQKQKRKRRH